MSLDQISLEQYEEWREHLNKQAACLIVGICYEISPKVLSIFKEDNRFYSIKNDTFAALDEDFPKFYTPFKVPKNAARFVAKYSLLQPEIKILGFMQIEGFEFAASRIIERAIANRKIIPNQKYLGIVGYRSGK